MIATHNIKVNGRWYSAGEEVPETKESGIPVQEPAEVKAPAAEVKEEPVKAEPTPKTSNRRRNAK